jgi:hypothetical protein
VANVRVRAGELPVATRWHDWRHASNAGMIVLFPRHVVEARERHAIGAPQLRAIADSYEC